MLVVSRLEKNTEQTYFNSNLANLSFKREGGQTSQVTNMQARPRSKCDIISVYVITKLYDGNLSFFGYFLISFCSLEYDVVKVEFLVDSC